MLKSILSFSDVKKLNKEDQRNIIAGRRYARKSCRPDLFPDNGGCHPGLCCVRGLCLTLGFC